MNRGTWVWISSGLLAASVAATIIANFLIFFGAIFALAIADLFLLGLAAFLASFFWRRRYLAFAVFSVSWVLMGLNQSLLVIMGWQSSPIRSVTTIRHSVNARLLSAVSISGDARPFVAAAGKTGEAVGALNVGGMLDAPVDPGNLVSVADVPDLLWRMGLTPIIDGGTYPAVKLARLNQGDHFTITLDVLGRADDVSARYEGAYWYPYRYPGRDNTSLRPRLWSLIRMAFHCNLWRFVGGQCAASGASIDADVEAFLVSAFSREKPYGQSDPPGPLQATTVISDSVIRLEGPGTTIAHMSAAGEQQAFRSVVQGTLRSKCEPGLAFVEFGSPGNQSDVLTFVDDPQHPLPAPGGTNGLNGPAGIPLEPGTGGFPLLIYCDSGANRTVTVRPSRESKHRYLVVRAYDSDWSLSNVFYLGLDDGLPRLGSYPIMADVAVIEPGSLSVASDGTLRLTIMEFVKREGGVDTQVLRRVDLISPSIGRNKPSPVDDLPESRS